MSRPVNAAARGRLGRCAPSTRIFTDETGKPGRHQLPSPSPLETVLVCTGWVSTALSFMGVAIARWGSIMPGCGSSAGESQIDVAAAQKVVAGGAGPDFEAAISGYSSSSTDESGQRLERSKKERVRVFVARS